MKSTAERAPRTTTAKDAFARARGRQALLVLAMVVVAGASALGIHAVNNRTAPAPISKPVAMISAPVAGQGMVMQVLVVPGQVVRKGQLLAVLNFSHEKAELANAEDSLINALQQ